MYLSDNNSKLLPTRGCPSNRFSNLVWPVLLAREGYLGGIPDGGPNPCGKGVWTCRYCDFVTDNTGGHGIVVGVFINAAERTKMLSSIENPSSTWLVGDVMQNLDPKKGWHLIWQKPVNWVSGHGPVSGRHGSAQANVCMFDGHVESRTIKELKDGKYTYADKATAPRLFSCM